MRQIARLSPLAALFPSVLLAAACGATNAQPPESYLGTWQPVSAAVSTSGPMTVTTGSVDFADGSTYALSPTGEAGVFRITGRDVPGQGALDCGSQPTAYVSFTLTGPEMLVLNAFWDDGEPAPPDPAIFNAPGACISAAYSR